MQSLAELKGGPVEAAEYVDVRPAPKCDYCKDTHYVENARGHVVWCPRCSADHAQAAEERATGLVGELRGYVLDTFVAAHGTTYRQSVLAQALDAARQAIAHPIGFVGWYGGVGTGKTHLMAAICNTLRQRDMSVHYTTTIALLDHLRDAFDPKNGDDPYSRRFERLLQVDVLALDELDRFNATAWAKSAFFRLLDHRYSRANECLTLWATNKRLTDAAGKRQTIIGDDTGYLESRLSDGRFLAVDMGEGDVRASLNRAGWIQRVEAGRV
ncbi:MAG: ATP-binding protein [Anaerovoracaceae bacterium]